MYDSEMKQIVGDNSRGTDAVDNCYATYADPLSSEFTCSGTSVPYSYYDSATGKLIMKPKIRKKVLDFCAYELPELLS